MRITLIIVTIFTSSILAFGQETTQDTSKKEFKNVIGIDATNFVSRFFNFSSTPSYFNSPYVISYRRIFKSNALRVGIGGNFQNNEGTRNDTLHPSTKRISLNLGVGFEHYCYLSKRWNFFAGAEAFTGYSYYDGIYPYSSISYREQSNTSYSFGVSPLIGVQFKINSRLSISTETSYNIAYVIDESFDIQPPTTMYDIHSKSSGIETSFYPPTAITFRIQL